MSARFTFLAWDTPIKSAPLKLALLQLANNADDDGFSYYSISKMATSCGMSERTFMRKISELEEMKVLTVERRANRPSLYTLVGDEMGVTLCHLQSAEVTECHTEVTECHLVGDRVSPDLNSAPNISLNTTSHNQLDYQVIADIYNETFPELKQVKALNDKRRRTMKKLFKFASMDLEKWQNYLNAIKNKEGCQWMLETRVNGATGNNWQAKDFDYFITDGCYIKVKES